MRGNCGGLEGGSLSGFQFFYCSIQFVVFFVTFAKSGSGWCIIYMRSDGFACKFNFNLNFRLNFLTFLLLLIFASTLYFLKTPFFSPIRYHQNIT